MTGLHRTDLTTSQKIQCAAQALAQQGEHGSKQEHFLVPAEAAG